MATFLESPSGATVDIGGRAVSNALDVVTDYGVPVAAGTPSFNTSVAVDNQQVDCFFDLHFDQAGQVYAPLVVHRFLSGVVNTPTVTEWIEVQNVSAMSLALQDFKLGDEESPGGTEGMFRFPSDATLAPGARYVVAVNNAAYFARFGSNADAEILPRQLLFSPHDAVRWLV